MALILHLETATKACSVSLARNGTELTTREITTDDFSHSENLNLFIVSLFEGQSVGLKDIDAVTVSAGPGSYTGLRIGASTAKGICYGLDIPLIAINSLTALATATVHPPGSLVCPMFDAMRMEVYAAVFDDHLNAVMPTSAVVVEAGSFAQYLDAGKVIFTGPGAIKCESVILHPNAVFDRSVKVSARNMIRLAEERFRQQQFEDVAYFEPFYLKDFIAGNPKKML